MVFLIGAIIVALANIEDLNIFKVGFLTVVSIMAILIIRKKLKYSLNLHMNSGWSTAYTTEDKDYIYVLLEKINEALSKI